MVRRLAVEMLFGLGLVLALCGAAGPASLPWRIKNVEQAAEGQGLVVGAIRYLKDGEDKKCADGGYKCVVVILPPDSHKAVVYEFEKSGDFVWSLPPGQYTILAFARMDRGWNIQSMRAVFAVPDSLDPVYIGDLLFATRDGRYAVGARDGFDEAATQFNSAYPDRAGTLLNGTVGPEENLGSWARTSYVCAPEWKVECTKNFRGVTPLLPADGKGFTLAGDLHPQFRWVPSADGTITYDVALYEAASFNDDGITRQFTEGRMIAYRQGLSAPEWRPDLSLEPDRKYYWSVRLRRGDLVSTWSSYSYFNFFIIGFSSGYGQWFKFTTPPAPKSK